MSCLTGLADCQIDCYRSCLRKIAIGPSIPKSGIDDRDALALLVESTSVNIFEW